MKKLTGLLLLILASSASALTVSPTAAPPKMDGILNDPCWTSAESADLVGHMGQAIKNRTAVQAVYTDSTLYIAFTCFESQMNRLVTAWDHPEERDNSLWDDDCVEMFFDPFASGVHSYHIIVNSAGTIADNRDGDWLWNPRLTVATHKDKDRWTVEVAIPFEELGCTPKGGEVWKTNLCREEKPSDDLSCLYRPMAAFATVSKFGPLVFKPAKGEAVFSLTRLYKGKLTAEVKNTQSSDQKFKVVLRSLVDIKPVSEFSTEVTVPAGKTLPVTLAYKTNSKTTSIKVEAINLTQSKTVYHNQFELLSVAPKTQQRVWQIDKPLYKELWSDQPTGLVKEGAIFWAHGGAASCMRPWACEYGKRYVFDEYYPMLAKYKLWPIAPYPMYASPASKIESYCRNQGLKIILQADPRGSNTPTIDGNPFLLDPDVIKYYEARTLKEVKECGDDAWAVSYGDEIYEINETLAVKMFATMKDKYPFILKLNEEVKKEFGGGKFGLPESENDKNPYRWIAFRKWCDAHYNELFTRLYKEIKEINPKIQVISPDPTAMHHPYDFSEWSKFSDILTHQLYPRCNANLATFGFHTKLIKDLTGMKEVWPCLHVENYAASFTPMEALEMISEAFRNGATGFHYYLCDTIGRYAKKGYMYMEYYGAPDRWQLEMDVMNEVRNMNQLRFPEKADCAIFYSCDSYASMPLTTTTDEVEVAYTLLGPIAGSWFKFINDYQIDRNSINLDDYKVIYVPFATIQNEKVIAKLADYVKNGGILICGDPEVFSHDTLEGDVSAWRKKLFGVELGGTINPGSMTWREMRLPISSRAYTVKPQDGTTVMARFANGSPALIAHNYGKGKTLYFASNPFRLPSLSNAEWKKCFITLQKNFGLAMNYDIWRFQFPASLIKVQPRPTQRCLTNNYLFWESGKPIALADVDTHGSYTFSPAPDGVSDAGTSSDVSFDVGKLTNRRKAFTAGNVDLGTGKLADWVVRYDKPEPFTLTFDFKQAYPDIEKVVLFYTGELPAVKVEVSTDGKTWQPFADEAAKPATEDVYDLTITGTPATARYVRLSFASRTEKKPFTIAECEVWAK